MFPDSFYSSSAHTEVAFARDLATEAIGWTAHSLGWEASKLKTSTLVALNAHEVLVENISTGESALVDLSSAVNPSLLRLEKPCPKLLEEKIVLFMRGDRNSLRENKVFKAQTLNCKHLLP